MDHSTLFHNLAVLSKVNQQDKLITNGLKYTIYPPTNLRFIVRWWQGDSRIETLENVKSLINQTMMTIALCGAPDTCGLLTSTDLLSSRLTDALEKSLTGLRNLRETYRDCVGTESMLAILVQDCETFLDNRKGRRTNVE